LRIVVANQGSNQLMQEERKGEDSMKNPTKPDKTRQPLKNTGSPGMKHPAKPDKTRHLFPNRLETRLFGLYLTQAAVPDHFPHLCYTRA
jgi:hypothetical protein